MFILFDYLINIFRQPTKIEEKQQQKNEKGVSVLSYCDNHIYNYISNSLWSGG